MRAAIVLSVLLASVSMAGCQDLFPGPSGGVGFQATDFLQHTGDLIIELDHVNGSGPNEQALGVLVSTLEEVTGRTVKVDRSAQLPAKGENHEYTFQELIEMADTYRDRSSTAGAEGVPAVDVIHMMYVDGRIRDQGNANILGLAFNGDKIAIAKGMIREISCAQNEEVLGRCLNGEPREQNVERAVLVHEGGHLLGLVNSGIPMVRDHEDPEEPGHSKFKDSVMWWGVETPGGISNLLDGGASIPYRFDEYDREDLRNAKRSGGAS